MPRTEDDARRYLARAISTATEPNAMGLFLHYHFAALGLAARWRDHPDDPHARAQVLATEAFALHFIEDSFSAGHVAGSWGSVAERKGTHDYYCEAGLDGSTWAGTLQTLKGDAHMRPEDLGRAPRGWSPTPGPSSRTPRSARAAPARWAGRSTRPWPRVPPASTSAWPPSSR